MLIGRFDCECMQECVSNWNLISCDFIKIININALYHAHCRAGVMYVLCGQVAVIIGPEHPNDRTNERTRYMTSTKANFVAFHIIHIFEAIFLFGWKVVGFEQD